MIQLIKRTAYGGALHVIISLLICGNLYTQMDNDYESFVRLWYRVQVDILINNINIH